MDEFQFFALLTLAALAAQIVGLWFALLVWRELGRSLFALLMAVALLSGVVTGVANIALAFTLSPADMAMFAPYLTVQYRALALVRLVGTLALTGVAIRSYLVWR